MDQATTLRYQQSDRTDAALFAMYTKARLSRRGWLMLLSGLAGFQRELTQD